GGIARVVESRMPHDGAHRNITAGLVGLDLVFDVADHAMRGREHEIGRERGAGAQVLARVYQHYDRPGGPACRWRGIAGHGASGGGEKQERNEGEDAGHVRASALATELCQRGRCEGTAAPTKCLKMRSKRWEYFVRRGTEGGLLGS